MIIQLQKIRNRHQWRTGQRSDRAVARTRTLMTPQPLTPNLNGDTSQNPTLPKGPNLNCGLCVSGFWYLYLHLNDRLGFLEVCAFYMVYHAALLPLSLLCRYLWGSIVASLGKRHGQHLRQVYASLLVFFSKKATSSNLLPSSRSSPILLQHENQHVARPGT